MVASRCSQNWPITPIRASNTWSQNSFNLASRPPKLAQMVRNRFPIILGILVIVVYFVAIPAVVPSQIIKSSNLPIISAQEYPIQSQRNPFQSTQTLTSSISLQGTATGVGVLTGSVRRGPVQGGPCLFPCDEPAKYFTVNIYDASGTNIVATTKTDANGLFQIALPEGVYTVFTKCQEGLPVCSGPVQVMIRAGQTATVTISVDTGLR